MKMASTKELFEKNPSMFDGFNSKDWITYYESLNAEKPVEECRLKMSRDEKECYQNALNKLKKERAENPGVPIAYKIKYSDFD